MDAFTTHRSLRAVLWALAVACLIPLVTAPSASAKVTRTTFDQGRPTGRFSQSPDRSEQTVIPGRTSRVRVVLTNYIAQPVHIDIKIVDIGPARDASQLVTVVPDSPYSAASWITPEITSADMQPLEQLSFDLIVQTPANAPVGTSMAGMTVAATPADSSANTKRAGASGTKVAFRFQGLSQLYFTVPGELQYDTHIVAARVADTFLVGGHHVVEYELELVNQGNVNDHVSGTIDITSLFGNRTARIRFPQGATGKKDEGYLILRGAHRIVRATWADTPSFGRFTAVAHVTTHEGTKKRSFPAVTMLPPWWILALLVAAIALPFIWRWWQRRRDMQLLIEAELEGWDGELDDDDEYR